jgi:hypothetical protein
MLGVASCSPDEPDATGAGELGNGNFEYRCEGSSDPVCADPSVAGTFPSCIALGASFSLTYRATNREFKDAHAAPASDRYFSGTGPSYRAQAIGRAAFVAIHEERVVDYRHFEIVAASEIILREEGGSPLHGELVLNLDDSIEIPFFAGGPCSPLGGALSRNAVSDDPSIASAQLSDLLRVTGNAAGETEIIVRLGELERRVPVVVLPGPPTPIPPPRRESGGADSGESDDSSTGSTDADTGTDTGTDTDGLDTTDTGTESGDSTGDDAGTTGGGR